VPPALVASPNPFTGSTTIRCASPLGEQAEFRLYDTAGKLVRTLPAGSSRILTGSGFKPGVYVLRAGEQTTRLVKAAN
jgi:hypothetical protein